MDVTLILKSLLFWLFVFLFPGTYALAIIVSLFYLNLGIFSLPYAFTMMMPIIAVWAYVVRKRTLSYMKALLDSGPHVWDIEKTLAEYQELLMKGRKEREG